MKNTHNVKNSLFLLLAVTLALLLCACSSNARNPNTHVASTVPAPTAPSSPAPSSPAVSNPPVVSNPPATSGGTSSSSPTPTSATSIFTLLNGLNFQSSLGAMYGSVTIFTISSDGSFNGQYSYLDPNDVGADYPNGTEHGYLFTGKFINATKVDDYTYSMTLDTSADSQTYNPETVSIDGGTRTVTDYGPADGALGFDGVSTFTLYMPGRSTADLPQEALSTLNLLNGQLTGDWTTPDTMPFYLLGDFFSQPPTSNSTKPAPSPNTPSPAATPAPSGENTTYAPIETIDVPYGQEKTFVGVYPTVGVGASATITMGIDNVISGQDAYSILKEDSPDAPAPPAGTEYVIADVSLTYVSGGVVAIDLEKYQSPLAYGDMLFTLSDQNDQTANGNDVTGLLKSSFYDLTVPLGETVHGQVAFWRMIGSDEPLTYFGFCCAVNLYLS